MAADLVAKLRSVVEQEPQVRLVVMFGSQATGRATSRSDLDIGILPMDEELTADDEATLVSALSAAANAEVDLIRLDHTDPLLGREVARSGKCIFENTRGAFAQWRARAMSEWIDFDHTISPHRQKFLQRVANLANRYPKVDVDPGVPS